jgi:preprotein translocase subunit SecG
MMTLVQPLWASTIAALLNFVLLFVSLFLILLVLIQRGKGGGLSGAFGGAGGSSAFGSRAGDAFTRITIYTAAIWLLLIMFLINNTMNEAIRRGPATGTPGITLPGPDKDAPEG